MRMTLLFLLLLRISQTTCNSRASVKVSPSRLQFVQYENMILSCEEFQPGDWTVWRYATISSKPNAEVRSSKEVLSQCGSGWGVPTPPSSCHIQTVKPTDSGVYWCESKHGESSNIININVTDKTDGSVMLQSPVRPVVMGQNVTLQCKGGSPPYKAADFYKDGSHIGTEPAGHMTIYNFSKSNEGPYTCRINQRESPPSWLLMEADSAPAVFTVWPDSPQQFEYEKLDLSCSHNSSSGSWRVMGATKTQEPGDKLVLQTCIDKGGVASRSGCILETLKKHHSGIYWCESPAGRRSNSIHITVHDSQVMLQSPALPVMEGHEVTLRCRTKSPPLHLPADFYKDGSFLRTEPAGHMTILHVSRSDEGQYKCQISGHGESPSSWLFVKGLHGSDQSKEDAPLTVLGVIRHLVVMCPYCISTAFMVSVFRHRHKGRFSPVSMVTSPPSRDGEGSARPDEDVDADVTTEHHF